MDYANCPAPAIIIVSSQVRVGCILSSLCSVVYTAN